MLSRGIVLSEMMKMDRELRAMLDARDQEIHELRGGVSFESLLAHF